MQKFNIIIGGGKHWKFDDYSWVNITNVIVTWLYMKVTSNANGAAHNIIITTYTHVYVHTHTCIHTAHTYAYMYIHTHAHTHACVHTHTHTQVFTEVPSHVTSYSV